MIRKKPMGACPKCSPHRKHARSCRSCACAYRSTAAKPVKARNEKRRPAALATAQREAVIERSGGRCELEFHFVGPGGYDVWEPCGQPGRDTAHIIRRRLCGDAIYHPDVALFACRPCHRSYDSRIDKDVRVPEAALARAIAAVKAAEAQRAENGRAVVPLAPKHSNGAEA